MSTTIVEKGYVEKLRNQLFIVGTIALASIILNIGLIVAWNSLRQFIAGM